MRQISPESEGIYDLILALYKSVSGDWAKLGKETEVSEQDVKYWVEYAAGVLANLGNYKVCWMRENSRYRGLELLLMAGTVFRRPKIYSSDSGSGFGEASILHKRNERII